MAVAAALGLLVASVVAALDIGGGAVCPAPATVAARVWPLLPPQRAWPAGLTVRVEDVPDVAAGRVDLELRLERAGDPAPIATRRVQRSGSCDELADTAAVIVASWAGEYETPPPAALTLADLPASVETTPAARPPKPAAAPEILSARASPPSAPSPFAWSAGAATWIAGASDGGLTPYVAVEATVLDGRQGWFARLLVAGTGERQLPVAGGAAAWWRLLVMPSVGWSTGWAWGNGQKLVLELAAGPMLGPVFVEGRGFTAAAGDVGLDVGIAPAARLALPLGAGARTSVWVGGGAVAWLRPHRLSVDGFAGRPTLPWLDGMAGGGVSYRWR